MGIDNAGNSDEETKMKVKDVMTRHVQICTPDDDLAAVAMIMLKNDCGMVPVMKYDCEVVGVITDRDICLAAATTYRLPSDITVSEVFSGNLYACDPHENVGDALKIMRAQKVRRLPVISANGTLQGIISMTDVVMHAEDDRGLKMSGLSYEDVVHTLKDVCASYARAKCILPQSIEGPYAWRTAPA
jgi:CBS domain-containing protein